LREVGISRRTAEKQTGICSVGFTRRFHFILPAGPRRVLPINRLALFLQPGAR
jgi:hypothetical protein